MFKRYLLSGFCILGVALLVGACGEKGPEDPYADVTLRQATRGKVVSKGFKYEFKNPKIVALNNHLGIIREGNLLEFISGRSLEEKLKGIENKQFSLGVVKEFSPFVHFRVERVFTGTDTIFFTQTGAIPYPHVTTLDKFDKGEYQDYNLAKVPYNRTTTLKKLVGKKFYGKADIVEAEEDGKKVYLLQAGETKFRIAEAGDGTMAVIKMLAAAGKPFEGGITFMEVEGWGSRRKSRIAGNVSADFVIYNQTVVRG